MEDPLSHIPILSSIRFLFIFYIVQGHFIQVAVQNDFFLKLFKQHNVIVGAFFLLSGFMLTLSAKSGKDLEWGSYIKRRLNRIYPVYLLILMIFAPMYVGIDLYYKIPWHEILKKIFIVFPLLQAWHPDWGLYWNSPTWFLSALLFCYLLFPCVFNKLRHFKTASIGMLFGLIFSILLFIKGLYSFENGFFFLEGMMSPDKISYFNLLRFSPLVNFLEFLLGVCTGFFFLRSSPHESWKTRYLPSVFLYSIFAMIFLRVYFPINDMLVRTLIFTPLFLLFLYYASFNHGLGFKMLSSKMMVFLGEISFSIYCLHGALGQFFYKRVVKAYTQLDIPYWLYLCILIGLSYAIYSFVEKKLLKNR